MASRKGLDRELYELRLQRYGLSTCKEMDRATFRKYMRDLARLPDAPGG